MLKRMCESVSVCECVREKVCECMRVCRAGKMEQRD